MEPKVITTVLLLIITVLVISLLNGIYNNIDCKHKYCKFGETPVKVNNICICKGE